VYYCSKIELVVREPSTFWLQKTNQQNRTKQLSSNQAKAIFIEKNMYKCATQTSLTIEEQNMRQQHALSLVQITNQGSFIQLFFVYLPHLNQHASKTNDPKVIHFKT